PHCRFFIEFVNAEIFPELRWPATLVPQPWRILWNATINKHSIATAVGTANNVKTVVKAHIYDFRLNRSHSPCGSILPSTEVQPCGARNMVQMAQCFSGRPGR